MPAQDDSSNRLERDKAESAVAFRQHVWPILRSHLGREVLMVEGRQDELAEYLDKCGIDAIQVEKHGGLIGIASRTLVARPQPFGTGNEWHVYTGFSLRYRRGNNSNVEFERLRRYYVELDGERNIRPYFCVQAIFLNSRESPPVYVACIAAPEPIRIVDRLRTNPAMVRSIEYDGAAFYTISTDILRANGARSLFEVYQCPNEYIAHGVVNDTRSAGFDSGRILAHVIVDQAQQDYYDESYAAWLAATGQSA